jgi:hypothetical protein
MTDHRLAFLNPRFPFLVRSRLNRRRSELTLTIRLQAHNRQPGMIGAVQKGLDALAGLGAILDRHEQTAARAIRVDATLKAWEKKKSQVRAAYLKLRKLNVRHRAAVRAVFDSPAFADLRDHPHRLDRSAFSSIIGPASLYLITPPGVSADPKVRVLSERLTRQRRTFVRAVKSNRAG